MNRRIACAIALIAGLGLAGTSTAQGRHDERPHGYDKAKAEAAAAESAKKQSPSATGGRHDDRPHGMPKKQTAAPAPAPK